MLDSPVIQAAGGVLLRKASSGDEVMLVHRKRYGDWTLPKGKLKPGETFDAAAVREVQEETGCRVELGRYLGALGYEVTGTPKVVLFWQMSGNEQNLPTDHEEVQEAAWLPVQDALAQLSHDQEREFLSRVIGREAGYFAALLRRHWAWFQWHERARLLREFESFKVELAFLEQRSSEPDRAWAAAAHAELENVRSYLQARHVEGGWYSLDCARRHALYGLEHIEILDRAETLREEGQKVSSWRAKAIKNLISRDDGEITPSRLWAATALRDEYTSNQYHKIRLMGDQLRVLLAVFGCSLLLLIPIVWSSSQRGNEDSPVWGYERVTAVLSLGLLGAAFSTAQSLITNTSQAKIPERVASQFVTLSRALFGAATGLAGYAFFQSGILTPWKIDRSLGGALAVTFLFGYMGERLIARVADSVGGSSS